MTDTPGNPELLRFAASIVSAHAAHNRTAAEALPGIIRSVYAALNDASAAPAAVVAPARPEPAVPVKKSVFPDRLVCLEDGDSFQALKRHLQSAHGLTPQEYRQKWGLPDNYPMVAPDYAAHRSALAKRVGLGRKAGEPDESGPVTVTRIPEGVSGKLPKTAAA